MTIPLPPLKEQQRLVEHFHALSATIEEAKRLRQEAASERRVMFESWLRMLFPDAGSNRVGDFVRFQTGYAFKSEWFVSQGVRLARNVNVGHGNLDWSETVCISVLQSVEYHRFALRTGDILISLDRPIISTGVKAARVTPSDLPALLLQRVARAEFRSASVAPDFFFLWLTSPRFTRAIDPGRSNGVPHISHKDIEKIPFTPPSLEIQHRVITFAKTMTAKKEEVDSLEAALLLELTALIPAVLAQTFIEDVA